MTGGTAGDRKSSVCALELSGNYAFGAVTARTSIIGAGLLFKAKSNSIRIAPVLAPLLGHTVGLIAINHRLLRYRVVLVGNLDKGISACMACHGPTGRGNPGAGYPVLAGQHATYTSNQLIAYRAGERQTDAEQNQVMRNIAALMSDKEIYAVASYIQGLQ